jgi:hypothetical protein
MDVESPVCFSADGKTVISATRSIDGSAFTAYRTFRVWGVAHGAEVRFFKDTDPNPGAVAFSSDGRLLANVSNPGRGQPPRIQLWDIGAGKNLSPIECGREERANNLAALAFSPDGKILASSFGGPIVLWEVATRREMGRFPNEEPTCLAFSPDGRHLASGSLDISVLLWDVTGRMEDETRRPAKLSSEQWQPLWKDLRGEDAAKARRAVWTFIAAGDPAVAFLSSHLRPIDQSSDPAAVVRLVATLDSPRFAVRSRAKTELAGLAELAEPALVEAEKHRPSLEQRGRIKELLDAIVEQRSRPTGDRLRAVRAVEILEQIHSPASQQLLQRLSQGAAGALLTRQAQEALTRLESRGLTASSSR